MEQLWPTVARGLNLVRVPLCIVAVLFGFFLFGTSLAARRRAKSSYSSAPGDGSEAQRVGSSVLERVAIGICAALALAGITAMVAQAIRRPSGWHPIFLVMPALFLFLVAPALLWRTTWRLPAEALATVMLAVLTFITGFSIGFLIVPLLAVMTWVCFHHLSERFSSRRITAGSG